MCLSKDLSRDRSEIRKEALPESEGRTAKKWDQQERDSKVL